MTLLSWLASNKPHDFSDDMRLGDRDKSLGIGVGQTLEHPFRAHPGIDQDRRRAGFVESEYDRNELDTLRDEDRDAGTALDAHPLEPCGDPIAVLVQFAERERAVFAFAVRSVPKRFGQCDLVRTFLGLQSQTMGDVDPVLLISCVRHSIFYGSGRQPGVVL